MPSAQDRVIRRALRTETIRNSRARTIARARLSVVLTLAATLLIWACSDGTAPAEPAPALLQVSAGDGQHAPAGTELPQRVIVQVLDASQRPLVGVHITWTSQMGAGDVITPESETTDGDGNVRARWRLDASEGTHILVATADGGVTAHASAFADAQPPTNVHALPVVTYEGSG